MPDRNLICKACDGTGLLADDENWQYNCTICGGKGVMEGESLITSKSSRMVQVDETNRVLD